MESRFVSDRGELRIAHLLAGGAFGGLESVVAGLASGMIARGHACTVLCVLDAGGASETPFTADLRARGIPIRTLAVPERAYWREQTLLRAVLARLDVHVLHTHGYRADVQGALARRACRLPVVSTVHGFAGGDWKNRAYESLQRFALRHVDGVVAVSRPIVERLVRSGVDRERVDCVPNAWQPPGDSLPRADARALLGVGADRPVCGWVGRLSREKAADHFIRALAKCTTPGLLGVIVGEGPERGRLEALAADCGIADRVRLCGAIPRAYRVFSAFDTYCLSSTTEGTPIALLEAMNARVPIVTTRVGGVPDVVSDAEARLVASGDVAALASAIDSSLQDAGGPRLERAFAVARARYGTSGWLARHEAIYERIMRETPLARA